MSRTADDGTPPPTTNGVPTVDGAALVDAVRSLDGVTDAAIAPDSTGNHALRLTLADGVDDAAVAAEVARMLNGDFGVAVGNRDAHLVEQTMGSTEASPTDEAGAARRRAAAEARVHPESPGAQSPEEVTAPARSRRTVLFERMKVVTSLDEVGAEVVLAAATGRSTGRASGPTSSASAVHTVARAALAAMDGVLAGRARCVLEDARVEAVGGGRIAVVSISLVAPGRTERVTGSAAVDDDSRQAVVRACLAALDRRVEALIGPRASTLQG